MFNHLRSRREMLGDLGRGMFVAGLGTHPGDTAIVRAVLDLGRALGLTTVAEGVETPEQLSALRDLGCDWAQGFHYARPLPAETMRATLEAPGTLTHAV